MIVIIINWPIQHFVVFDGVRQNGVMLQAEFRRRVQEVMNKIKSA